MRIADRRATRCSEQPEDGGVRGPGDKGGRVPVKLGYYDGPWVEVRDGLKEAIAW